MLETIVTALLPIVVTLLLGYFAGLRHDFSQDQASVLNRMVMLYALPLLLFTGILSTPLSEISKSMDVFLWISVGMVGGFILVFLISRFIFKSDSKVAALRAIAIAGPAVPFVGTPVLGVLFPIDADLAIAAGSILMNLIQVPLALVFLVGNGGTAGEKKSPLQIAFGSIKSYLATGCVGTDSGFCPFAYRARYAEIFERLIHAAGTGDRRCGTVCCRCCSVCTKSECFP